MKRLGLTLLALLWVTSASAEVAPYSDWLFRLERAGKNVSKIRAVAAEDPVFARIWFYGHIFDLSIAGISKKETARIQRNTKVFAEVLSETDPPDWVPALLASTPPEKLRADFDVMQAALNAALNAPRPVDTAIATLEQAPHELIPHAAFYALLHRADIANPRLGGRNDAQRRLEAARGFAEALAVLEGDLEPWRALALYRGQDGVVPNPATIPESRISEAFNAIASTRPDRGRAAVVDGRRAVMASGSPAIRGTLLALGPALIAEKTNAVGAHLNLAAAAKGLPQQWMQVLLLRRALLAAARARDAQGAVQRAQELAPFLETIRPEPEDDWALIAAIQLWQATGLAAVESGQLADAAALFEPASRWASWLRRPERLAQTVPERKLASETKARSGLAAGVMLAHGRLQLRLGRTSAAVTAFKASREMFQAAEMFEEMAAAELATAEAQLLMGDLVNSLELASTGLARIQNNPLAKAEGMALRAQIRLRRGDLAPAFANANAGLTWLKHAESPRKAALRGRLHALAAAALDADGQTTAAEARLAFGRQIHDTPRRAVGHSALLMALGRAEAAMNAVKPHENTPLGAIAAGCIEQRRGQSTAAAARLAAVLKTQLIDLDLNVRGRACLAAAWHALGKSRQARDLGALTAAQWAASDPAERWALHVAMAAVDDAAAEGHRAKAIEAWRISRGDGHLRTLLEAAPRAYQDVGEMVQGIVATDLARKSPQWSVSLPLTVWWPQARRAMSAAAPRPGVDMPQDDLMTLRGGYLASMHQGRILADPAVQATERAAVLKRRAESWQAAQDAADMRLRRHARWAAYAAPIPPVVQRLKPSSGRSRLYIQTGAARSRAWIYEPKANAPVFTNLPGRDALRTLRSGLDGHLAGGAIFTEDGGDPHRSAWRQLQTAAKTLAPRFLSPKTAPTARRVEVVADDGPLQFFAWSALVNTPPRQSGQAPRFFAQDWHFEHRLSVGALPATVPAAPNIALLCGGPCDANLQSVFDGLKRRGGQVQEQATLQIPTPLAHVKGVIKSDGIQIGTQKHTFNALARLNSKPFQVAISGEVQGARREVASSLIHSGATVVALPLGSAPIDGRMPLHWAWNQTLGQKPVTELVFQRNAQGAALETRLSPIPSPSSDLGSGLGAAKRWMATQPVRFGSVPLHHPSQWARWLILRP